MWKSGVSGELRYLAGDVLLQRAAAEGDDAAAQVGDREHDAVAEAVVGHRNVVAGDQQARPRPCPRPAALRAEVLLQREALGRRIAEPEFELRRRIEAAVGEIAARAGAGAATRASPRRISPRAPSRRAASCGAPRAPRLARDFRQRHAGHRGQPLDRLGKVTPSVSMTKSKMLPFLPEEKSNQALLVVDEERRRLLLVERRQALPLAARPSAASRAGPRLPKPEAGPAARRGMRREAHGVKTESDCQLF